ncbi:polyamine deacetylase HDAC10 [Heteronotia binoei]|uniref:polyamine deacetylase HDAC10 n=1 Tax=Heteronotia binoei TaxID=13085 RepID=UPI00292E1CA7|nr:polyamine deacetylase HDAC10 [Heteronotia binoei]
MASETALVYDDEMTNHKLLWEDPICAIETPERLSSCYKNLRRYNLVERCLSVPVREGMEDEITLVHSLDYLQVVKNSQKMSEEELRRVSANYDAVFFHPTTYRCAKLAVGATLQLVDAVMSGTTRNGMALVRPPGHHSQRNAANGFCVFNNVAIAAKYAQRKYGVQRVLIVDWDVHHGQGIQYIFEEDPSVLYFSWHRFEHQKYWPSLRESNYDAVGWGKGEGFNINVPWNKVGMTNSDYLAVFLHVLLPVAFEFDPELVLVSAGYDSGIGDPEGQMSATPECYAHLTHFLMHLAKGKVCVVLEGGYHLRSLSESVCMTIKTLLGDPLPSLSGEMKPCLSALESIHDVRAAHKSYWKCLSYEDLTPLKDLSTKLCQLDEGEVVQTGTPLVKQQEAGKTNIDEATKTDRFLELHMKEILSLEPAVKTLVAVAERNADMLPSSVQIEKNGDSEELKAIVRGFAAELVNEEKVLRVLGNMLAVLEKIVEKKVTSGLVVSPEVSLSSVLALKHCQNLKLQKVLCVFVGDMDMKIDLVNGKVFLINICGKQSEQANTKYSISINWKEDAGRSSISSMLFGFILPVAYSYQPELVIIAVGSNHILGTNGISLLISLLQGLAQSRILAVIQETEVLLLKDIAKPLTGNNTPCFGTCTSASQENIQTVKELQEQFQQEWKMLQCSVNVSVTER